MKRKKNTDDKIINDLEESTKLRNLVNGLHGGEDEFSDQPGSGSSIGGTRGELEYGIKGGIAAEESHSTHTSPVVPGDEDGVSGFSAKGLNSSSEEDALEVSETESSPQSTGALDELRTLLPNRIMHHPKLKHSHIMVRVSLADGVTLHGSVHSEAEKIAARELAQAVAMGISVNNKLVVEGGA